jgi:hypothetical protein
VKTTTNTGDARTIAELDAELDALRAEGVRLAHERLELERAFERAGARADALFRARGNYSSTAAAEHRAEERSAAATHQARLGELDQREREITLARQDVERRLDAARRAAVVDEQHQRRMAGAGDLDRLQATVARAEAELEAVHRAAQELPRRRAEAFEEQDLTALRKLASEAEEMPTRIALADRALLVAQIDLARARIAATASRQRELEPLVEQTRVAADVARDAHRAVAQEARTCALDTMQMELRLRDYERELEEIAARATAVVG